MNSSTRHAPADARVRACSVTQERSHVTFIIWWGWNLTLHNLKNRRPILRRVTTLIAVLFASYLPSPAETIERVPLKDLFVQADVVAYVEILSGVYKEGLGAMYRAKVVQMFKGSEDQAEIVFGPFSGYR